MFLQRVCVYVCVLDAISAYVIKQISMIEFLLLLFEYCFHYSSIFFLFHYKIDGWKRRKKKKKTRNIKRDNKEFRRGYDLKFGWTLKAFHSVAILRYVVIFTRGTGFQQRRRIIELYYLSTRLRYKIFINYISLINYD